MLDNAPIDLVLFQPEIPQNTGNIGRLCVGFKTRLSLIKPLGFEINDKNLKRAGLDYWQYLDLTIYPDFDDFYQKNLHKRIIIISKFSKTLIHDFDFRKGDCLMMGNETKGFPKILTKFYGFSIIRIPMGEKIRSYNLANSSSMVLYEAYRQLKW